MSHLWEDMFLLLEACQDIKSFIMFCKKGIRGERKDAMDIQSCPKKPIATVLLKKIICPFKEIIFENTFSIRVIHLSTS